MTMTARRPTRIATGQPTAAVYYGTVRHQRRSPLVRDFTPKLFLAYLDVDALPHALDDIPCWSARRAAPIRYRRRDFFDRGTRPLGAAVRDLVDERLGRRPSGSIFLLAQLRTVGLLFNPLAVYYCWAADGAGLDAIVLEVTNTPWGERQWYVFDARADTMAASTPKEMYVSPFLPMDVEYHVEWTAPGDVLSLRIEVERAGRRIFGAHLALRRSPLDRRAAMTFPARYPLMPLRGLIAIYREAMRLSIRRVPLYRHPARSTRA